MKICVTSDLHGILPKIEEPCEVVLICGDIMPLRMQRNIPQSEKWLKTTFAEWVNNLPCESVIMVGGNHDFALANMYRQPLKINSILSNPTNGKLELLDNEATSVISKDGIEYRIANGEPLPTYKTIEALKEIYNDFTIITSAETYKEIPRWQHGEDILKDNKFLVVDVAHFNSEDIPHDEVKVIYAPDITICSTAIRKWVDDGKIILPFVTDEVNSIIRKLGLYK